MAAGVVGGMGTERYRRLRPGPSRARFPAEGGYLTRRQTPSGISSDFLTIRQAPAEPLFGAESQLRWAFCRPGGTEARCRGHPQRSTELVLTFASAYIRSHSSHRQSPCDSSGGCRPGPSGPAHVNRPERFVPLRRRAPGAPGLRAHLSAQAAGVPVDRRHPHQRRKCLTPEPRVAPSAPRSDLQSVQGRPPFPAPAPRDECSDDGRPHSTAHLEPSGDPVTQGRHEDAEAPTRRRCHRRAPQHEFSAPTAEFSSP